MGLPYDNGINLSNEGNLMENMYAPNFDSFTMYNTKKCIEIDGDFCEKCLGVYPEFDIGEHSRGNKMGFWRWKPYIIKYHLSKLSEGEILIYKDSNSTRYEYFMECLDEYKQNIEDIIKQININVIVPIENPEHLKCKHHVKKDIFETIGKNNEYYRDFPLLNANRIIIRKSNLSVKFIDEWFNYCMDDNLIFPEKTHEPDLRWSTHDQAILSVLYRKYIEFELFPKNIIGVYIKDKVLSKTNIFYTHFSYWEKLNPYKNVKKKVNTKLVFL